MKLLLDTQVVLMVLSNDKRLSPEAMDLITSEEHEIYYSAASVLEIQDKHKKSPLRLSIDENTFHIMCSKSGLKELELSSAAIVSGAQIGNNPNPGRDNPYACILLAQAREEGMTLVTKNSDIPGIQDSEYIEI